MLVACDDCLRARHSLITEQNVVSDVSTKYAPVRACSSTVTLSCHCLHMIEQFGNEKMPRAMLKG